MARRYRTNRHIWLFLLCSLMAAAISIMPTHAGREAACISWKKTVVDKAFRSEGVAVADVNRDGRLDILAGEVWYEAPHWKIHQIQTPGNYGDGANGYSHCFASW